MADTSLTALALRDPQAAARLRRLSMAEAVMRQGADTSPVATPLQGIARMLTGAVGGYFAGQEQRGLEADDAARTERRNTLLAPFTTPQQASGPPNPDGQFPMGPPRQMTPQDIQGLILAGQNDPVLSSMIPGLAGLSAEEARRRDREEDNRLAREREERQARLADRQLALSEEANRRAGQETFGAPMTVRGPDGAPQLVQMGNRGTIRPVQGYQPNEDVDNLTPGRAQASMIRLAPGYAAGTLTPAQEREFEAAVTVAQAPRVQLDPATGQAVTITPPLPPFVTQAVQARQAASVPQPAAPPAAAAAPEAAPAPASTQAPAPAATAPAPQPGMPNISVSQIGGARPAAAPAGFRWAADGSRLEAIPGGPQDPTTQPLTEAEGRSNLFGSQMQMGDEIIRSAQIPSSAAIIAWRNAPESAVNMALSENDQQYFNALRLFAAGVLRRETGAAFTNQELMDVQSRFFPMPGDSPAVVQQKARARAQAISSIQAEVRGGLRGVNIPGTSLTAEPPPNVPPPPPGFQVVR